MMIMDMRVINLIIANGDIHKQQTEAVCDRQTTSFRATDSTMLTAHAVRVVNITRFPKRKSLTIRKSLSLEVYLN